MKKSFTKLTSIALIGGLIGRGLRYGLNIIVSRGLGPEALGLFAFGMVLMKAVGVLARSGLDNAAQKFIPIYQQEGDVARVSGIVLLCVGAPFIIGSVLGAAIYLNPNVLLIFVDREFSAAVQPFAVGIPLFAVMMVGISATKGLKETKYSVYIRDFGQSIAAIVLVGLGVYIAEDLQMAVVGYVGSFLFGVVLAVAFLLREEAIRLDVRPVFRVREVFVYSIPLTITALMGYVLSWTDIFVLSAFTEPRIVGWYQAAYQTSVLLIVVLQSASAIFPAVASDLYHNDQREQLGRMYTAVTKWITYFTLLAYLFLIIYAAEVLAVFDITARSAQLALIVIGFGQLVNATAGPVGYLLTMTEYERIYVVNTIIVAVFNAALNIVLVLRFGIIGAAAATAVSFTLNNLLTMAEVWYLIGIQPYTTRYWKGVVAVGGAVPVMIVGQQLPIPRIAGIVLVAACSFCVFAGLIWLLGVDEADRTLLESIAQE